MDYALNVDVLLLLMLFTYLEPGTPTLYRGTLGCLELGTYQQLNLSCANDSLIYIRGLRHGHSSQSATADQVTCSPVAPDDGWCEVGPPYDEMVKIQCNSRSYCTVFLPFHRKVAPPRTSRRQGQPAST